MRVRIPCWELAPGWCNGSTPDKFFNAVIGESGRPRLPVTEKIAGSNPADRANFMKRVNIKAILQDPAKRRELMVRCIIATQAREGIKTTREQAERAYDKVSVEE